MYTSTLQRQDQVTIPKDIVKDLNLQEGDMLEISVQDGCIRIEPIAVYPKEHVDKWIAETDALYNDIVSGERVPYNNIDDLLAHL